jgi:hypothetical protein
MEPDDPTVEVGYNPIFGPSNPMDTRTILGTKDSYMVDDKTRNDDLLPVQFVTPTDPELGFNADVTAFRKSLDVMETLVDPFLQVEVPRHVAPWYGYPEPVYFAPKNFTNNRFTEKKKVDFDTLTPHQARTLAVQYARETHAEWLPTEASQLYHQQERAPYEAYLTRVGTLRPGPRDPQWVSAVQPVLDILGSCVELLEIIPVPDDSTEVPQLIYRFYYHGLMKNKHGMKAWIETMIREDCGVTNISNVILETGFRRRDPAYDGGDPYYGPRL